MLENSRGLIKALENWAKKVTTGYRDVNVRDLSTSFRDGLAFCAIIHHYRPDLINFDSLAKENILENNSLAFSVAEKQLGVPALLDAEDMVQYSNPDRLSIITYLSQLRNCFENQNKVNLKKLEKRVHNNISGPPAKVPAVTPSLLSTKRHEVCQVCKQRVFILQRLMVSGKLYHTTCFRCNKCNALLNPGAYVESDTPGLYECSVCLVDEPSETSDTLTETPEPMNEQETVEEAAPSPKLLPSPKRDFTSIGALKFAKSNLSPESPSTRPKSPTFQTSLAPKILGVNKDSSTSVKDRINVFEKNQTKENPSPTTSPSSAASMTRLRQSFVSNETPVPSNRHSTQGSLSSVKCSDDGKDQDQDKRFSSTHKLPTEPVSKDSSVEEDNTNIFNVTSTENDCDSNASVISLNKVPKIDLEILPNQTKDSNSENKSVLSLRSGAESPKVSRDIFKTSLQPLKLNLPSSLRKEQPTLTRTSLESEKVLDVPQIKSSYSVTLPRMGISRNLSLRKDPVEFKSSNSETNVNSDESSQNVSQLIRRSSLESSNETSGNKQLTNLTSPSSDSKLFSRTISVQEISFRDGSGSPKSPLKNYTPIYKSILSGSSLTSSPTLRSSFDILSKQSSESKNTSHMEEDSEKKNLVSSISSINSVSKEHSGSIPSISERASNEKKGEGTKDNLETPPDSSKISSVKVSIQETKEEDYPDDLNPFGDEEEGDNEKDEEYPDDLNPFGEEEEEEEIDTTKVSVDDYDESKNPFASDEDDDTSQSTSNYSPRPTFLESKPPNIHDSMSSNLSSPSGSLKGTLKKRPAPKPPTVQEIFKDSGDSSLNSSITSVKSSPASAKKAFQTSSPKIRKNKPAPPPPPTPPIQDAANVKMSKETDNLKLKSSMQNSGERPAPPKQQFKKKKRPAPSVPIPRRQNMKKIPLKEIMQEMKEIEEKQREYERQGQEIELLIRDQDKDEEPSVEEEEYIIQLFELVNQKNALFRRQAELMYIKRSQRLEEQQHETEKKIRILMEKPESEKTDEDRQKEEELTMELLDIVDQRNSIIDSIEMDRRRELEEDHSIQEQMDIKNGDLPITAEIKQKSKNKNKKAKEKKEKKKLEDQQSAKGTLKKKKIFSKK